MNRQHECVVKNQFKELKTDSYIKLRIYIGKRNHCMPCTYSQEMKVLNAAGEVLGEKVRWDNENTQLNLGHGLPTHINPQWNIPTNLGVGWESVLCFSLAGLKEIITEA